MRIGPYILKTIVMHNLITKDEILSIVENFDVSSAEYEVVDMEKYQGWSSKHLYLLTSPSGNLVLKAKTPEQIGGYNNEVMTCRALLNSGILTRRPILTKTGDIFHKQHDYYWCLMTYIPGEPSQVDEYNENTITSLADYIDLYITISNSGKNFSSLDIKKSVEPDQLGVLDRFIEEKEFLKSIEIIKTDESNFWCDWIKKGYKRYLSDNPTKSIIHNDINPNNIVVDKISKRVISLIDWDHVGYGDSLKDLGDTASVFYDYLPSDKASAYRKLFYKSFTSKWFTAIDPTVVDLSFLFYYTSSKWQAILFYLDLLRKYGDKYGEYNRFINEMEQTYIKWRNVIVSLSSSGK